jgi:hypothetical protein
MEQRSTFVFKPTVEPDDGPLTAEAADELDDGVDGERLELGADARRQGE